MIDPDETNLLDQKELEFQLQSMAEVSSLRLTLSQISESIRVDPQDGLLYVQGKEIGLVYYRSGYQEG